MILNNTPNTNFVAFDSTFGNIGISGGKVTLKRCQINSYDPGYSRGVYGITVTNTELEAIRMTNTYGIGSVSDSNKKISILQSYIGRGLDGDAGVTDVAEIGATGNRISIGYCKITANIATTNCKTELIGNIIIAGNRSRHYLDIDTVSATGGDFQAHNNVIGSYSQDQSINALSMRYLDGNAIVCNNTIYHLSYNNVGPAIYGVGVFQIKLISSIVQGIRSPNSSANPVPLWAISFCAISDGSGTALSASGGYNNFAAVVPPISLKPANYLPNPVRGEGPLIGGGPPEAVYNNRGTTNRNNIGYSGGPYFDLTFYTNTGPLVYLLTGTPQIFSKDRNNSLSISAAAVSGD